MPLVKHLVRTEDRCQHVLHGQRTQARLNFEHALREFRCLGGREFFAELRKNARNGVSMPLSRSDVISQLTGGTEKAACFYYPLFEYPPQSRSQ